MSKLFIPLAAAVVLAGAVHAAPAAATLGPDAAACRSGRDGPAILVNVSGFKNREGTLRLQLYGADPKAFLAKGARIKRIDLPVARAGTMPVCIAVPRAGQYAVAVRHDADANGTSGWSDGGGFSRNPRVSLMDLRPKHSEVVFTVGDGVKPIDVVLNYRRGLSIGPAGRR